MRSPVRMSSCGSEQSEHMTEIPARAVEVRSDEGTAGEDVAMEEVAETAVGEAPEMEETKKDEGLKKAKKDEGLKKENEEMKREDEEIQQEDEVCKWAPWMSDVRAIHDWSEQISRHMSHTEGRLMHSDLKGHEAVRHFMQYLSNFSPPPRGDWGWVMRKCHDLSVSSLRMLVQLYLKGRQ